ncbi:WD-40 repeat protein [Candidatus Vecturithrix granuli]|uniref:WD-40 repeat protein n=1 Tax=Vecturithrix granuli TaxID=1499967 RepID=A0A081BUV0_VECG1|nr:WD-40 repeat protein [Candidatus Vecturithrix granuli]
MKYFRTCYWIVWCFLLLSPNAYAAEPILVIDPHGHSSQISALLFTPDGKTLISTSWDKTIRLWDVETGDLRKTLRHQIGAGHDGEIHAAALSPDGKILAVGGIDCPEDDAGTPVYLFDLERGEVIGLLRGHPDIIGALDFSRDGKWLASSSYTTISIWDMSQLTNEPVLILESESEMIDLAFAPDTQHLVSSHVDGKLRLWKLPKNMAQAEHQNITKPEKVMTKHAANASRVDYSPDGKYIVSGDFDDNVFLWTSKGKFQKQLDVVDTPGMVVFSPDSKQVFAGEGGKAILFSIPKGKQELTFEQHVKPAQRTAFSSMVTAAAFYSSDLIATAGGNEYEIYIWNRRSGEVKTHIVGQGKRVEAVAFGADLHLAFGNTFDVQKQEGPLERSFDFAQMQLSQKLPVEQTFNRYQTEYQGHTLQYTFGKWYELQVTPDVTIHNSPSDGWVRSYTFTSDGSIIVGSSQVLKLHRPDGSVLREFVGHTGEIWAVSLSQDGHLLASASDDQTMKIWNIATGECLATLFIARDREWVCWTPNGYYAASAGGEKYIGWQINKGLEAAAEFYPVSVFRKQFYHPELVKQTLALASFDQAFAAFIQTTPKIEETTVTQVLPPKVQWILPETSPIETSNALLRIQAEINSETPLTLVKILVNGRTQAVKRGLTLPAQQREVPHHTIDQDITLAPGQNILSIFAANENAGATSEERIVLYHITGQEELKPDLYLISIGISKYLLKNLELVYADDDARAISRVFQAQTGKLYKTVQMKELYDREATQKNILQAIEWVNQSATPNDVVIIFVAAHGINDQGRYYILPADGLVEDLAQTAVSWPDFADILGNLPARVLLFLDTCHSGQIGLDVSAQTSQRDNTEAIRELASDDYGVVILAASTGREFSLEDPGWEHGAFTKAVLEALEQGKADYSNDSLIHLRELDLYVAERVEALTNGEQHPTTQKPSTISRFPIVQLR